MSTLSQTLAIQPRPHLRKRIIGYAADRTRLPFYIGVSAETRQPTYLLLPNDRSFLASILISGPSGAGKSITTRILLENFYIEWKIYGHHWRHPCIILDSKANHLGINKPNTKARDRYLLKTIHPKWNKKLAIPNELINVYLPAYTAPTDKKSAIKTFREKWQAKGFWGVPWRHITDLAHLGTVLKVPAESLWCLPPETIIITNQGGKRICDVQVGDLVLTHRGRFRPVRKVLTFPFKGELFDVHTRYSNIPLSMSSEHKVLVMSRKRLTRNLLPSKIKQIRELRRHFSITQIAKKVGCAHSTVWYVLNNRFNYDERHELTKKRNCWMDDVRKGYCTLTPQYKLASELTIDDVLLFPRYLETIPSSYTSELAELLGWYVAEGSNNLETTYFWMGRNEHANVVRVGDLIQQSFGKNPKFFTHKGCECVRFSSRYLTRTYFTQFGKTARSKFLPPELMTAPFSLQYSLLKGMIGGDGCLIYKNGQFTRYATSSLALACSLRTLLFRLGIVHSLYYNSEEDKYEIRVGGKANNILRQLLELPEPHVSLKTSTFTLDDYVLLPIKEISTKPYEGTLYHLEVEEDETYTTINGVVHNSEELRPTFDKASTDPDMTLKGLIGVGGVLYKAAKNIRNAASRSAALNFVERWRHNRYWFENSDKLAQHLSDPFSINVLTFVETPEKIYFNQLAFLIALESLMATLQESKEECQPVIIIHDVLNFIGEGKPFRNEILDALKRLLAGQARTLAHGYVVIIETQSLDLPKEISDPTKYTIHLKLNWKSQSLTLRRVHGFVGGVATIHDHFNNFYRPNVVVRPPLTSYTV